MHRRAVTQHFRDTHTDFCRIITDPDDGIGPQFAGLRDHLIERVLPRLFT